MLGFWIYLMSDCLIFAMLFATYGVLGAATMPPARRRRTCSTCRWSALNTSMLLLSSITYGFAMLAMDKNRIGADADLARRHRPHSAWPSSASSSTSSRT